MGLDLKCGLQSRIYFQFMRRNCHLVQQCTEFYRILFVHFCPKAIRSMHSSKYYFLSNGMGRI